MIPSANAGIGFDLKNLVEQENLLSNLTSITETQILGVIANGIGLGDTANYFNSLKGTFTKIGWFSIFVTVGENIITACLNDESIQNDIIDLGVDIIFTLIPMIVNNITTTIVFAACPGNLPLATFAGSLAGTATAMVLQVVEYNGMPLQEYIKVYLKKNN